MNRSAASLLTIAAAVALGLGLSLPRAHADDAAPPPVVLHVGDSFVMSGLAQALKVKFEEAGVRYVVRSQQSLYTGTLSRALGLPQLLASYKPTLVLVTVGANEMRMPRPDDHAGSVRRLSQLVGQTSCVWITPPPPVPQGQTGIVQVIARESSPCLVYDSTSLAATLPRASDKVHPSREGGAIWANAFWDWLQTQRVSHSSFALKPREAAPAPAPSASASTAP